MKLAHSMAPSTSDSRRPSTKPNTSPQIMPRQRPLTNSASGPATAGPRLRPSRDSSAPPISTRMARQRRSGRISEITLIPMIFETA